MKFITEYKRLNNYIGGGLPFTLLVNQNIGKLFTMLFLKLSVSPNLVTAFSLITNIIATVFIIKFGITFQNILVFSILTQVSYSLDCSDGQLARITKKSSLFGSWFDLITDRLNTFIVLVGIFLYFSAESSVEYSDVLKFCFILGVNLFYAFAVNLKTLIFPKKLNSASSNSNILNTIITFPGDNGIFLLIISLGLFTNQWFEVMFFYSIYILILLILFAIKLYFATNVNK